MVFQTGLTQTGLYSHRKWLETRNFGFRKKRNCSIRVAKTKTLNSFKVTAKLICIFGFAYADCWFSHDAAHFMMLCLQYFSRWQEEEVDQIWLEGSPRNDGD